VEKRLQNRLADWIRQVANTLEIRTETDQELLQRFLSQRDEAAFAAVVRRHGPMVLRVALRTLQNEHDAEDVFQATFLVLSQKAHTVRRQESLGSWLYGIAYRLALKTKATAGERRNREQRVAPTPAATPLAQITVQEAQTILDEELNRLPKKLREPVVLCCLEGLARDEAALQIGCEASVLKNRLEQGRERLRQRLIARGLTLSCGLSAFLVLERVAGPTVRPALIGSTTKAAIAVAAGKAASVVVTAKVAALTEGVLRTMFLTKIIIATVALLVGMMGLGGGMLIYRTLAAELAPKDKSHSPTSTQPKTDQELIQGTWVYVSLTVGGKKEWNGDMPQKSLTFAADKVRLVVNEDGKEVAYQGHFKLNASRKPREIDVTELDGELKGKITACLYEIDGDTLRLCHPEVPGGDRPRTLDSKESSTDYLWTLKRSDKEAVNAKDKSQRKPLAKLPGKGKVRTIDLGRILDLLDGDADLDGDGYPDILLDVGGDTQIVLTNIRSHLGGREKQLEKSKKRPVGRPLDIDRDAFPDILVGGQLLDLDGTTKPSDIAGEWSGWGKVVLKKTNDQEYSGTYSGTFGKQPGEIHLKWSRVERRFNGTWRENENRFGELSVRLAGKEIRGAHTTDPRSKINPAAPRLADFCWIRTAKTSGRKSGAPATGESSPPTITQPKSGKTGGPDDAVTDKLGIAILSYKLGGRITVDENSTDKHIVDADLANTKVTDTDLVTLKRFMGLQRRVQSLHSLKNLKDLQVLVVARSTTWVLAFRNEGPILGSG